MAADDPLDNGKADPCTLKLGVGMKPVDRQEHLCLMLRIEACAVVSYMINSLPVLLMVQNSIFAPSVVEVNFQAFATRFVRTIFLLAKASGRAFDIVILDLTVKRGMGGEEAVRKLQ